MWTDLKGHPYTAQNYASIIYIRASYNMTKWVLFWAWIMLKVLYLWEYWSIMRMGLLAKTMTTITKQICYMHIHNASLINFMTSRYSNIVTSAQLIYCTIITHNKSYTNVECQQVHKYTNTYFYTPCEITPCVQLIQYVLVYCSRLVYCSLQPENMRELNNYDNSIYRLLINNLYSLLC